MSVLATLERTELAVEPGAEASLLVRVRNRGTIVDRFDIAVVGPTARWTSVDQPSLRLFPDKEGEARITFRPPRAPNPAADTYTFGVSVRAASDASSSTVEEGRLSVSPFVQLTTEIVPQTSRGSRSGSHDVTVHNIGNAVAEVSVKASDPDRLLTFEVVPGRAGLRPDASVTIRARVKPRQLFFLGPAKRIPFTVQVDEPTAGSYQVPATLEHRAIIPGWVRPAAGLAIIALAAVVFLPSILFPPGPSAAPSQVGVATATPETLTPAPVSEPPSAAPTPSPRVNAPPTEFLAAGERRNPLSSESGLKLICPRGDECRDTANTLLGLILVNLQGRADGGALIDFETNPTGTLPVFVEWTDGIFQYSAIGAAGETNRIRIDLAPFIAGVSGYVLVFDPANNQVQRFMLPPGDGKALYDLLYRYEPEVIPTPAPLPPGGSFDFRDMAESDRAWVFNVDWLP